MEKGQNEGFKIKNPNWQSPKEPFSFNSIQGKNIPNVYDACLKYDQEKEVTQIKINTEINNLKTEKAATQKEIIKLSYEITHDELTGCYNKVFFENFKKKEFDRFKDNNKIALVFIDLNNLKKTNDELGHEAGDALIKKNADFLKNNFNENDYVIRLGGDEFLIICRNKENEEDFETKLFLKVDNLSRKEADVDFAFGVAVFNKQIDLNLDNTKHRADIRMYENKNYQKKKLSEEV